jgi:hypothetical protein
VSESLLSAKLKEVSQETCIEEEPEFHYLLDNTTFCAGGIYKGNNI